jgi:hypothetical protein
MFDFLMRQNMLLSGFIVSLSWSVNTSLLFALHDASKQDARIKITGNVKVTLHYYYSTSHY